MPYISVCGMMLNAQETASETTEMPVSCCPVTQSSGQDKAMPVSDCHPADAADSHTCVICPCEYKATTSAAKSVTVVVTESEELILPVFANLLETILFPPDTDTPDYHHSPHSLPDSGTPLFIRNCCYLI